MNHPIFSMLLPLLLLGAVAQAQATPPTGKPAQPPFKLTLTDNQNKIFKGELKTYTFAKSWTLDPDGVARSEKYNKLSPTLMPMLDRIEAEVNARKPRPAVFKNVDGQWIATDQNGWIFDRDGTRDNVRKAISLGKTSAQVAFARVVPERSVKVLAGRGVLWHVSTGKSSYAGSPDFRETNILVGADKLDNFFIAPDHEFDFNKEIGQIDASTGFVPGFIISGGTLAKEDGGGICQVSTTVFRALYGAGLPITDRSEHSHRVTYYDPVGFEATVYAPYKNLKVKNDTGAHLFVQASWNRAEQSLCFDVFGANTGREVTVGDPVISDFKAPAAPSFTPDPSVGLGRSRLLDTPMQGMTSVIQRTVKVKGKTVSTDLLKSVYAPWGAVYGVNPADARLR
ncbi:VanW family protein [Deinococcus arenicola]|uniref:VanW family protein n=1 Tax=Deinococcus arenicola TaxID=2994950 RepID=A0ABU4DR16_9DEIO|nr:VanW family protein [Deinococcus sp. ZS9-10]MDV6374874.1 VanW family protein [Deinococcus sp. ZS9-10]